jgi:uncharacterized MAPEG superfamily protein
MNLNLHQLRKAGLVFAWFAALFFFKNAGWIPAIMAQLAGTAVWAGVLAARKFGRDRVSLPGRGLAVAGGCLVFVASLIGLLVLAGLFFRQSDPGWQHQDREQKVRRLIAERPLDDHPAADFTSNLPIIVLRTGRREIRKEHLTVAAAQFIDVAEDGRAALNGKPAHEGLVTLRRRGHSSLDLPKASFTLHTVDERTNQVKVALLGLPKEEDWVLYAPFEDKSLIRDVLAYQLAAKMGHYAPRTRYVELFLRGDGGQVSMRDYAGVYVLIEKIKRGPERVNIAKLEPQHNAAPEITGGYIVKRDHGDNNDRRFHTQHGGGPYFFVSPNGRSVTSAQKNWLAGYFSAFEAALQGEDFDDPKTGYAAYLDVDSFIDAHWLIETGKNVDGFRYSAFLTKDRGGKIKTEPPWDWNRSFGNANYYGGWRTEGWYWTRLRPNEISWYRRLQEDPKFAERCAARWRELRRDVLDPQKINALIDAHAARLAEAQERNFKRWPVLGVAVTCNHFVGNTYEEEVNWLKNWIKGRIAWIDKQFAEQPVLRPIRSGGESGR